MEQGTGFGPQEVRKQIKWLDWPAVQWVMRLLAHLHLRRHPMALFVQGSNEVDKGCNEVQSDSEVANAANTEAYAQEEFVVCEGVGEVRARCLRAQDGQVVQLGPQQHGS